MQFFKTKVCAFWKKGRCTRGVDCKYAHGDDELQETPDLTNTTLCRNIANKGSCDRENCPFAHSREDLRATPKFYKTSMCPFYRYGRCRLGAQCRHAHTLDELCEMPAKPLSSNVDDRCSNASVDFGESKPQTRQLSDCRTSVGEATASLDDLDKVGCVLETDDEDDFPELPFTFNVSVPAPLPTPLLQDLVPAERPRGRKQLVNQKLKDVLDKELCEKPTLMTQAISQPSMPNGAIPFISPQAMMGMAMPPLAAATFDNEEDCFSQDNGWGIPMVSAPAVLVPVQSQDFARAMCAHALEIERCKEMEAAILRRAMPESYED